MDFKEKKRIFNKKYRETHKEQAKFYGKTYWQNNKEKLKIQHKEWYEKNRDSIKHYRCSKEFRLEINEKMRKKRITNKQFARKDNLYGLLNQAINYYERNGKVLKCRKYPIDFEKIIKYLSPFPDRRMNQIDHIKPLCSFDLTDSKQIQEAFAPENHRWLLAQDNKIKNGKV
jgi:hypothetical protein